MHLRAKHPDLPMHELDLPRLALYHNWVSTQPDGWVRYTLEAAGVELDYINDDDVRAGDLNSRYDLILIAHRAASAASSA